MNGFLGEAKRKLRRFFGHRILLAASLAAVICVLAADRSLLAGGVAVLLTGISGCFVLGWRKGGAIMLVGLAAAWMLHLRTSSRHKAQSLLLAAPESRVEARVLSDARGNPGAWTVEARILDGPVPGAHIIWIGRGEMPVAGSRLTGKGAFAPPRAARNPGEFDRVAWMERSGIAAELDARRAQDAGLVTPRLASLAARFRQGFQSAILHGLDADSTAAQVISAMVVGRRPADGEDVISAFRNSGTLHVFSVSGLHVAMVGGIGWLCLGWCGVPRRHAVVILLPLMFGYAWVTGNGPPAVRAAWMAALFLGAFVFRRKPDLLHALGTVLLATTLWDGRLLFQPGVQLSYGVVAAIGVGMGPASRLFGWISAKQLYLPDDERSRLRKLWDGMRARLASSLSVSFAAALGSAPLTMWHFGLVTPVSLLANLVLLPLVFAILLLGLLGAALCPVLPRSSAWVNRTNSWLADLSVVAADAFASIPGGHIRTRRPDEAMLLVYDLPYGACASVLTDSEGHAILSDCGGRGSFRHTILPSLDAQGIAPETIVLSHPDGAHMGGGYPVWRHLPLRAAVLPVEESRSPALRAWKSAAAAGVRVVPVADVPVVHGPDGSEWHRLCAPYAGASDAPADDRVAVWRLDWRGWRILFTSDAGFRTEQMLLDSGADVRADVIIAGKHRNDLSLGDDFLTAVDPRAIVAKNPEYPSEERLAPGAVESWRQRGIRFVDQAITGGVTLVVDANGDLVMRGHLVPESPVVLRRK